MGKQVLESQVFGLLEPSCKGLRHLGNHSTWSEVLSHVFKSFSKLLLIELARVDCQNGEELFLKVLKTRLAVEETDESHFPLSSNDEVVPLNALDALAIEFFRNDVHKYRA